MRVPTVLFGVPIDNVTMAECLAEIGRQVDEGRAGGHKHQIATVNVDFLVNALEQPDLMELLQASSLNLADGMPIVWGSAMVGARLPERVAGADLVPALGAESASRGWKLHLYGGAPGVADRAREHLLELHPGARITADEAPMISDVVNVDDEVLERIERYDADIVCVALGNPKQERFIAAHRERLSAPVMVGIGGSLDMLIGDKRRAPALVQRTGTEWIFRAAQEPGRLGRRYLHDIRVFAPQIRSYVRIVRRFADGSHLTPTWDGTHLMISGSADPQPVEAWNTAMLRLDASSSVQIDVSGFRSLTSASHAGLIGFVRAGLRHGVEMTSTCLGSELQSCLGRYGTLSWLQSHLVVR